MDRFKELMNSLGAKEMPVLESDFDTSRRNYELKEDGFTIRFFEGTDGFFGFLVEGKHKCVLDDELLNDEEIKGLVRLRIKREKEKINAFINKSCQDK